MSERALLDRREPNERLAVRRRRRRRRFFIAWAILLLILIAAAFYGVWRPGVRVAYVTVEGGDSSLANIATLSMQGSMFGLPRNSIFFVPKARIRSLILAHHPNIAALSISRTSPTSISIRVDNRVAIARWCGTPASSEDSLQVTPTADDCYLFDAGGFVYATATAPESLVAKSTFSVLDTTSTSTNASTTIQNIPVLPKPIAPSDVPLTPFIVFDSFVGSTSMPVESTLTHAAKLPSVFDFARHIATFGASVEAIAIRGDEVDFFLQNDGPRITYLLGDEENAFTALKSAQANFTLSNHSVQYVDLRFPGKVYIKRNVTE